MASVRIRPTALPDVLIIEPDVKRDARGFFLETYHAEKYRQAGLSVTFVQDNHSRSVHGTLRGLHAQRHHPQGKLVRVVQGEIFDVAVDIREGSPTFGHWVSVTLAADTFLQCYIPPWYAHGFLVTSEVAEVEYKCTDFYDAADELTIRWDDPMLAIAWPTSSPILSAKDRDAPRLGDLTGRLPRYQGIRP